MGGAGRAARWLRLHAAMDRGQKWRIKQPYNVNVAAQIAVPPSSMRCHISARRFAESGWNACECIVPYEN